MDSSKNITYPKITIITPSFNQGKFLEETILSVINQNYPSLEYMIIDGGSTDNSVDIIKKYEKQITFWLSEKDSGQSEAINKGLKKASGQIITWLNSDDCYEPGCLMKIAETFWTNKNIGLVHGKSIVFGQNKKEHIVGSDEDLAVNDYLSSMHVPQPSSFFLKEAFHKIGPLNESMHYAMDFELFVKLILEGYEVRRLNDILSRYRLHETSKSNEDSKFLPDWGQVVFNLFNSVTGGNVFAKEFKQLNITSLKEPVVYHTRINLSENDLELIFLKHLNLHYHFNYRFLNYALCKKISDYLKLNYPAFYQQEAFHKFDIRLKFIPGFMFRFIRKYQS